MEEYTRGYNACNRKWRENIKDKIEEYKERNIKENKDVKIYEEMRRKTSSKFYKKSYLTAIHKLNSKIETRKDIIKSLQGLLEREN